MKWETINLYIYRNSAMESMRNFYFGHFRQNRRDRAHFQRLNKKWRNFVDSIRTARSDVRSWSTKARSRRHLATWPPTREPRINHGRRFFMRIRRFDTVHCTVFKFECLFRLFFQRLFVSAVRVLKFLG